MERCHCPHVDDLIQRQRFQDAALRFVAIATPIILGIATFIVLVTRGG